MWFALSLIALLCWSGSDMFSKIGSKPSDKLSHWKMVMAVGLVMGLHAAYEIFIGGVEITWGTIVAYLPASFMYILSMTLGYVGLRYIELSVSSPICNSSGGIAAVLCFLFLQEMPGLVQWIGVAVFAGDAGPGPVDRRGGGDHRRGAPGRGGDERERRCPRAASAGQQGEV